LVQSGLQDQAAELCRKAVEMKPVTLEQWWELGVLSAQTECFPETERCFREIIERNSSIPGAWLYLGVALQRQQKLEAAESALISALQLKPEMTEAYYYLAVVQQSRGDTEQALKHYLQVLEYDYEPASTCYNVSLLLAKQGNLEEALDFGCDAIEYQGDNLKYRQNFTKLLRTLLPARVSDEMRSEIIRCFQIKGVDAATLMKPGMTLLAADLQINRLMRYVSNGDADAVRGMILAGDFSEVFCNELLINLLMYTKIASPEFERMLTMLREFALDWAVSSQDETPDALFDTDGRFLVALACQFFNTDYAAFVTPDEAASVEDLISTLEAQTSEGSKPDAGFRRRLAVIGMYRPMYGLQWIASCISQLELDTEGELSVFLKSQWFDYYAEQELRESVQRLTPIVDRISTAVRDQYEESPYPRWTSVNVTSPINYQDDIKSRFPFISLPGRTDQELEVLIAGCGTGRHAIMTASHYQGARVLAVDLSLASLTYAQRNARELGITNITFAQADILALGTLGKRFQLIESDGVLHHMENPEAGLRVLVDLLCEGGLIHVGLYSELGRRDVVAARQYIHATGLATTPDGMRQVRKGLTELDANHPARSVLRFRDFYTLGECRDLLFHVQEKRFTIGTIRELLKNCGLEFVGFDLPDANIADRYQEMFPDDSSMHDLNNWEKLEMQYPDTFAEMYQFLCQKI